LLKAVHRETVKLDTVVVVDCPTDIALERLLTQRGFDRADAEARIRAQISREERCHEADYVLDNSGDRAALESEVAKLWDWLVDAQRAKAVSSSTSGPPPPPEVG
jgi:dephospho-CoA kinase